MRSIQEISDDINNALGHVMEVIIDENKDGYVDRFESATKAQEEFEEELRDCVISSYNGHEKFSKEVLNDIYDLTYSSTQEYARSRLLLPEDFKKNMVVIEKAYLDGFNASKNK